MLYDIIYDTGEKGAAFIVYRIVNPAAINVLRAGLNINLAIA